MKGALGKEGIPIFKFRISGGDRILYTYGKYLSYIFDEKDSVVLLEFSPHDTQARRARSRNFAVPHGYDVLESILERADIKDGDVPEEDLREVAASLVLSENLSATSRNSCESYSQEFLEVAYSLLTR